MSLTAKAIWMIERNLGKELSLDEIADACGVSRFHLARAFEARVGRPVIQYLRARRLSQAATALAGGAPDILIVALDAGYGSHEAFTRAFHAQFGVTPEAVRRQKTTENLKMTEPANLSGAADAGELGAPRLASHKAFDVIGLAQRQSLSNTQAIPGQWQAFMSRYGDIADKANPIPLSVTTNMDADGTFDYLCGVEVSRRDGVPNGLTVQTVPAQTYAVFTHTGHVAAIGNTYAAIWDRWLPESGKRVSDGPWLERHLPTFNPQTGLGGIEIWIPIV